MCVGCVGVSVRSRFPTVGRCAKREHNCTTVCSFFCNRHLRTVGGTDYIPAIQRRLLHNQAGLQPGALSLIDPNPEGYIIHYG